MRDPCLGCEFRQECKSSFLACDVFLAFAKVTTGWHHHKPMRVPTRHKYYLAFPSDRARLGDKEVKTFNQILENVRECA